MGTSNDIVNFTAVIGCQGGRHKTQDACSQTETTSLSVVNVSVARVFFKPSVIGKEASGMHDFFFPERHEA